jgi:hypothetical protein
MHLEDILNISNPTDANAAAVINYKAGQSAPTAQNAILALPASVVILRGPAAELIGLADYVLGCQPAGNTATHAALAAQIAALQAVIPPPPPEEE